MPSTSIPLALQSTFYKVCLYFCDTVLSQGWSSHCVPRMLSCCNACIVACSHMNIPAALPIILSLLAIMLVSSTVLLCDCHVVCLAKVWNNTLLFPLL